MTLTASPAAVERIGEAVLRGMTRVAALVPVVPDCGPTWTVEAHFGGRAFEISVRQVERP